MAIGQRNRVRGRRPEVQRHEAIYVATGATNARRLPSWMVTGRTVTLVAPCLFYASVMGNDARPMFWEV